MEKDVRDRADAAASKKNVLLIVPKLDQGGLERVCVRTARIMGEDCRVFIAAFDPSDPAYDLTGLSVYDLHAPAAKGKAGKVLRVFDRARKLRKLKKKLAIDVAYSFGPTANRANVAAGGRGEIWCGLRSFADLEKERELAVIAQKSSRLICCSRALAKEAEKRCSFSGADVLYNPYRIGELAGQAKEQDPELEALRASLRETGGALVVSMGRKDYPKGYWHLLKAFSLLAKKMPAARLAIVGSGDFSEYEALAQGLGIREQVIFTGLKKNPFPWLAAADLYVGASLFEGFPNALVEAMALGTPVISTNCMTGPAEILTADYEKTMGADGDLDGEYGMLVAPLEPEENLDPGVVTDGERRLFLAMERMLAEEGLRAGYAEAARLRAAEFSEEAYRKKLLSYLSAGAPIY